MIIYIHGFGGSGEGSKANAFREYFKSIEEPFIAPSLSYVPELAVKTLEELIKSYHCDVKLIGSSLGGYYTMYLAQKYDLQAVLINPSIKPYKTLQRTIGEAPNFYDDSAFKWTARHIEMLKKQRPQTMFKEDIMLLVQKGDELLDYKEAVVFLPKAKTIVEEGGSHSFEGIERHFETIRAFFAVGSHFKHTAMVKGVGFDNRELAHRTGDLYYDHLAEFLGHLSEKIASDAEADRSRGRKRLADALDETAGHISQSVKPMQFAWEVCKAPTMKWMSENGYNRKPDFFEVYAIPEDRRDFDEWSEVRDIYGHTRFLPYVKEAKAYVETIIEKLKEGGWELEKRVITPEKESRHIGDCDIYWRHYRLERYVAGKDNRYFYFDHEMRTEESAVFVHYGDDTKVFVESALLQ